MRFPRVLIIEDDPDQVFLAERLFRIWGWRTAGATDLDSAFHEYRAFGPDLVTVDLKMVPVPGDVILDRLRQAGYRGPIVILTGLDTIDLIPVAMTIPVDRIFSKDQVSTDLKDYVFDLAKKLSEGWISNSVDS